MKRFVMTVLLLFLGLGIVSAQYRINKTKYDYKTWSYENGDPYNPTTCGILSVIPGVGQAVAHEYLRGLAFYGGAVGCLCTSVVGFAAAFGGYETIGVGLMIGGLAGFVAVDIWSVVDATRVAKVNNLAWRDYNSTGLKLKLEPFISPIQTFGSVKTQAGLSLKVNF